MGKTKAQYADELIKSLECAKQGGWVSWIDEPTKDAVIEVCQNVIESWCGRGIDHVKPHESRHNAEDNNPLNELKGKKIDAYEMAVRIEELAKKLSNEDTINGLCGAIAIIYDLAEKG